MHNPPIAATPDFNSVIENTDDIIVLRDVDGRVLAMNQAFKHFTRKLFNVDFQIGMCTTDYLSPEKRIFWEGILSRVLKGERIRNEFSYKFENGEIRYYEISLNPIIKDGMVIGTSEFTRDITGHKKAEEGLRQKHEMLKRTEAIAHVGSWAWEIESDTVTWSEELYRIFQLDPDDEAPNWVEHPKLYHPEDFKNLRRAAEAAIAEGKPYELELRAFRKDGETRICKAMGFPETGKDGQVVRLFGLLQDITEHKKAVQSLKQSEQKFHLLFDNAPIGYQSLEKNACFLEVNQAWLDILGYERQEVIGKWFGDFLPPEMVEIFRERFKENIQSRELIPSVEFPLKKKDGSIVLVDYMARIGRDDQGHFLRTHCAFSDITEKKKSEQALRESEEKYRSLVEEINDIIYSTDSNGVVTYISSAVKRQMGYETSEIIGKNFLKFVHTDDHKRFLERFREIEKSKILPPSEYRLLSKSGDAHWIRLSSQPIFENGQFSGIRGIFTDITEAKKLEDQLRQAQKMESIGSLAGGIAHDFNNILFPIVGMAEMIVEDLPQGSQLQQNAKEIFNAGTRGAELVKQILAFSRQSKHELIPTRAQKVLDDVLHLCRRTIPSEIEIHEEIGADCGLVMADSTQLHQVGMNLITNAFHAVEESCGKISVVLEEVKLDEKEMDKIRPPDLKRFACHSLPLITC